MNCQTLQTQIESASDKNDLSVADLRHLETCAACREFKRERESLRALVQNLETVNAPADFNFRLKARLREQKNDVGFSAKRKLMWLAPATLAAVVSVAAIASFQLINTQSDAAANRTAPAPAIAAEAAPQKELTLTPLPSESVNGATASRQTDKTERAEKRRAQIENKAAAIARNNKPQAIKEKTFSRDVGVGGAKPSILPKGFSDALRQPAKLDAGELLKTFGVQTVETDEGLRVVELGERAARSGLQKNDVIEKINDQNPAGLSNNLLEPLKITVRRQNQTVRVSITN